MIWPRLQNLVNLSCGAHDLWFSIQVRKVWSRLSGQIYTNRMIGLRSINLTPKTIDSKDLELRFSIGKFQQDVRGTRNNIFESGTDWAVQTYRTRISHNMRNIRSVVKQKLIINQSIPSCLGQQAYNSRSKIGYHNGSHVPPPTASNSGCLKKISATKNSQNSL